jgi:hypothetical protein
MSFKAVAGLAALAAVAVALVVAVPANAAGNAGTTQVSTFDPTGAVFTCPGVNYTVLGGTIRSVFHGDDRADGRDAQRRDDEHRVPPGGGVVVRRQLQPRYRAVRVH